MKPSLTSALTPLYLTTSNRQDYQTFILATSWRRPTALCWNLGQGNHTELRVTSHLTFYSLIKYKIILSTIHNVQHCKSAGAQEVTRDDVYREGQENLLS